MKKRLQRKRRRRMERKSFFIDITEPILSSKEQKWKEMIDRRKQRKLDRPRKRTCIRPIPIYELFFSNFVMIYII